MKEIAYSILDEIKNTIRLVDEKPLFLLAEEILQAKRVFVAGSGRSEQNARIFAMRLMHLSIPSYVVRDVTTPAITKDDLLIVFANAPENKWLCEIARKSYSAQAAVAAFSLSISSPIADLAKVCVFIPKSPSSGVAGTQSAGVVFDQTCMILSDMLVIHLARKMNKPIDELIRNRSNLE